ncbi:hypothetical protein Gorai_007000 [Gossypium raimondii]|uniref:At2g23090-like zinc-binding domain-containing protein n=1 Tax=Gossypium raimondii TaxID=29730 RepID=A0A7J8Q6L2_GOSRA|nr:hypothetical protein [Gossypium raimondii]
MGGGNGQKSRMAREKHMEKNKPTKGKHVLFFFFFSHFNAISSQLESNKEAMTIQCKVCMQAFICTTSEVKCKEHAEAKHPKSDIFASFPHLKK